MLSVIPMYASMAHADRKSTLCMHTINVCRCDEMLQQLSLLCRKCWLVRGDDDVEELSRAWQTTCG